MFMESRAIPLTLAIPRANARQHASKFARSGREKGMSRRKEGLEGEEERRAFDEQEEATSLFDGVPN